MKLWRFKRWTPNRSTPSPKLRTNDRNSKKAMNEGETEIWRRFIRPGHLRRQFDPIIVGPSRSYSGQRMQRVIILYVQICCKASLLHWHRLGPLSCQQKGTDKVEKDNKQSCLQTVRGSIRALSNHAHRVLAEYLIGRALCARSNPP